jgi:hypothetical protein
MTEYCAICNCPVHRTAGTYAKANALGRSHASEHHFVAERFFGRSANRPGTIVDPIFSQCPWAQEGKTAVFCYECHEELLHNPVLLQQDIQLLAALVEARGLAESGKTEDRSRLAGRIKLFQEIISRGIQSLRADTPSNER